jgi:rubrerythrin
LNALVSLHTKATPSVSEKYGSDIKDSITEHIELEREAIDTYRELLETIDDESEKTIIRAILNDEIKHHSLLKTIQKMIVDNLSLSEKEFWDMVEEDQYSYIPYSK